MNEDNLGWAAEETRTQILSYIADQELGPGDRLGAERSIASALNVSRTTLRLSLKSLEETGIIIKVPGRSGGIFIAPRKIDRDLSHIVGVPQMLRDQGFTSGTKLIRAGIALADRKSQQMLGLSEGDYNFDVIRIRLADGKPISLERARFPSELFPGFLELPIGDSLYELMKTHYDTEPDEVVERIDIVKATSDEALILGVAINTPLFLITRTTTDKIGRTIEYSHDLFLSDRTRLVIHTKEGASLSDQRGVRGSIVGVESR
jgi:GntR family transcriptional regulator